MDGIRYTINHKYFKSLIVWDTGDVSIIRGKKNSTGLTLHLGLVRITGVPEDSNITLEQYSMKKI